MTPFYLSYDTKNKTNTHGPCACVDDEETIFSCFHRVYPPGELSFEDLTLYDDILNSIILKQTRFP
jgi:hypothetical protein